MRKHVREGIALEIGPNHHEYRGQLEFIKLQMENEMPFKLKGIKTSDFMKYFDGFSFTVKTELDAYKAAYKYQGCKSVSVKEATNIGAWLVQVYN